MLISEMFVSLLNMIANPVPPGKGAATPVSVDRGRQVECAAGGGGDGDRIDFGCQGEWNLVEDLNWVIDIPEWCLKYRCK